MAPIVIPFWLERVRNGVPDILIDTSPHHKISPIVFWIITAAGTLMVNHVLGATQSNTENYGIIVD